MPLLRLVVVAVEVDVVVALRALPPHLVLLPLLLRRTRLSKPPVDVDRAASNGTRTTKPRLVVALRVWAV
jgi:hypothetical protein